MLISQIGLGDEAGFDHLKMNTAAKFRLLKDQYTERDVRCEPLLHGVYCLCYAGYVLD